MKSNFAALILTNRRPKKVITYKKLREHGYTGKIYLVVDDMDDTIDEYKKEYSEEEIVVFNKKEAMALTDTADNNQNPRAVVYARNMCHKIAKDLGLEYFVMLDDDYVTFVYRNDENNIYKSKKIKRLDDMFSLFIQFLESTNAKSIALAQGGDFIGGKKGTYGKKITLTRKCMNSFFCKTDRPFKFYGLVNEDVCSYTLNGSRGDLFFTMTEIMLDQVTTQQSSGGLTTIYLEQGTYVKSFYSVINHPSSIKIGEMHTSNTRIHHVVNQNNTYPKILREAYKKV